MGDFGWQNQRRSIRLHGYDYRQGGAYFVTVCVARLVRRNSIFGRVENPSEDESERRMQLNSYGRHAQECWLILPQHFAALELDEFVVMPNHFHGIVVLPAQDETSSAHAHRSQFAQAQAGSLGTIIGQWKIRVTQRIQKFRRENGLPPVVVWQKNYYERIIRNERELEATRSYILQNPQNWLHDENNPTNLTS